MGACLRQGTLSIRQDRHMTTGATTAGSPTKRRHFTTPWSPSWMPKRPISWPATSGR